MKKVIIYGGTTEGRVLAENLAKAGIHCLVFVATEYGQQMMKASSSYIQVHVGRLTAEEMAAFYASEKPDAIVDATHPYATAVRKNIAASRNSRPEYRETPFFRIHREEEANAVSGARYFDTAEECAEALKKTSDKVFLTTGSKTLPIFARDESLRNRLIVRVLPSIESLEICKKCQITGDQIIAMQGPFSMEMNEQMLRETEADILVLKESGKVGGESTRIAAAQKLDVTCYIIQRPKEGTAGTSEEAVEQQLKELLQNPDAASNNRTGNDVPESGITENDALGNGVPQNDTSENPMINPIRWEISLIGAGMNEVAQLTKEAGEALQQADVLFGAPRLMEGAKDLSHATHQFPYYRAAEILPALDRLAESMQASSKRENSSRTSASAAILFSGDTGFYSGCAKLYEALKDRENTAVSIYPGISSVSAISAAFGISWQDAALMSAHGIPERQWVPKFLDLAQHHAKTICLTSGCEDVRQMGQLLEELKGTYRIHVGYRLGSKEEQCLTLNPAEAAAFDREGLSTVLIENFAPRMRRMTPGWSDDAFDRERVPMTKEEIRSLSICKLRLTAPAVVYDIGSGSGSITAEIASLSPDVQVYSIESKADAAALTARNVRRHHLHNVTLVEGEAPEALKNLPAPTHVFIGGSGGQLRGILGFLQALNSPVRVVLNTVSLETLAEITQWMDEHAMDAEVCQVSVSRSHKLGEYHLMQAQNPVCIISFDLDGTVCRRNSAI